MREVGRPTLLDFAIGASLAVVPVMLAIVLAVGVFRTDPERAARAAAADRHVGLRQLAALKTFEAAVVARPVGAFAAPAAHDVLDGVPACRPDWGGPSGIARWAGRLGGAADRSPLATPAARIATQLAALDTALLRFGSRPTGAIAQPLTLDPARWFAAARAALTAPLESPSYPGQRFQLGCADLAAALSRLLRDDARMLESLAWRATEPASTLAGWRAEQQMQVGAQHVMRRNPWRGIAGCIYLGNGAAGAPAFYVAGSRSAQRRICGKPELAGNDDPSEPANGALRLASASVGAERAQPALAAVVAAEPALQRGASAAPQPIAGEPGEAAAPGDARWAVPPSLDAMLQPLETLRQPSGLLYRIATEAEAAPPRPGAIAGRARPRPNRVALDGAPVDVGFSIDLTIDARLQALAQQTAACYTGRHDVCRALGMRRAEDAARPLGGALLEGAMVRMAAIAIVDVASGRIEAIAGTRSRCARGEVDGPGRAAGCDPRVPYATRFVADALLNPAVFHPAMPASTIKPIMAAAFLGAPGAGAGWLASEVGAMRRDAAPARDSLRGQLLRSDSARFLDRMFCFESGFANCARAAQVQHVASAFGWNAGCADPSGGCGSRDLLFGAAPGSAPEQLTRPVAYGRLLSEPAGARAGAPMHLMALPEPDRGRVARCAAGADGRRGSDDDWEKCRGGALVDVVAEGWGQGHAQASALGVAGMMATLASAANGSPDTIRPHLVEAVRGVAPSRDAPAGAGAGARPPQALLRATAAEPHGLAADAARVIVSGLSYSHRIGTARSACEQVLDARTCQTLDGVAGKTGTPSFPGDGIDLDALAALCAGRVAAPSRNPVPPAPACAGLRPYKWYAAVFRDGPPGTPWTKAIAVLAERNWLRKGGQIHGAGDHGPNPAAEIALQIVARQTGLFAGEAR